MEEAYSDYIEEETTSKEDIKDFEKKSRRMQKKF